MKYSMNEKTISSMWPITISYHTLQCNQDVKSTNLHSFRIKLKSYILRYLGGKNRKISKVTISYTTS